MTYLIITILIILFSIVYLKVADKFNIIDKPTQRGSHTVPTIRGGGVLFVFALLLFAFTSNFSYPYFIIGTLIIALVSFIDDLITLSSTLRLPFQIIAVLLLFIQIFELEMLWYIYIPLVLVGVGFINLFNFMDGINGITGLYSLSVLLSLLMLSYMENVINVDLLYYQILALVVFGFYNFRKKALCFAGDIGSISIAMVLLFVVFSFMYKLNAPVVLLFVITYYADSVLTLMYRIYLREAIGQPHRRHIYQKLTDVLGWPHLKTSTIYAGLQLLVSAVALKSYCLSIQKQIFIVLFFCLLFVILYVTVFNKIEKVNKKTINCL